MLFVLICKDIPGDGLSRRLANRPTHLAYLESLGDKIKAGGAMLASEGGDPCGSLLIVEAESLEAAKAIAAGDPFSSAGVFESVEVLPWRQSVGVVKV